MRIILGHQDAAGIQLKDSTTIEWLDLKEIEHAMEKLFIVYFWLLVQEKK